MPRHVVSREACDSLARVSIIACDVLQDLGVTPQICALTRDRMHILKELETLIGLGAASAYQQAQLILRHPQRKGDSRSCHGGRWRYGLEPEVRFAQAKAQETDGGCR